MSRRESIGRGGGPESDEEDAFGEVRRRWHWRKETTKVESAAQNWQPVADLKRLDGRDDPQARLRDPNRLGGYTKRNPGETQGRIKVDHVR